MAKWQRTLDLLPEWRQCQDCQIRVDRMAAIIADRLSALTPLTGNVEAHRQALIRKFRRLSKQGNLRVVTFDAAMHTLYNWADTPLDDSWNGKKTCWVKTF
jgi:hypothetical protein